MKTQSIAAAAKRFENAEETRQFENGRMEMVRLGEAVVGKVTLMPGWRWSKDVRPLAGTELCQAAHTQYALSGRLIVAMEDGSQLEVKPGDAVFVPPGHDAWVVGNEPFVAIDFTGAEHYASRPEAA